MPGHVALPSFNTGEMSPLTDARVDIAKFRAGCRELRNFLVLPYGGARKRPGAVFAARAKYDDRDFALLPFRFSTGTNFVLEFGDLYIRFFSNRTQVESGGSPYEIVSPYTAAQLFDVQFAQINDVVFLTHPDHPPYRLSRVADTNWTMVEEVPDYPALLDQNITATTITPSATTGTGITLTASADTFEAGHVGAYFELAHERESNFVERELHASSGQSATISVLGPWNLYTTGNWDGVVKLQRSLDAGATWETIRTFSSVNDHNIDAEGNQEDDALFRIDYTYNGAPLASSTFNPRAAIEVADTFIRGIVKITGYTSATSVTADVVKDMQATTATKKWSEGAWSGVQGYPRTVTLHEQRLVFAGTAKKTQTLWFSKVDDYGTFFRGTAADDAFTITIGAREHNGIEWVLSKDSLLIGTSGGEVILSPGSNSEPLSPTNVKVENDTNFGSAPIKPALINEAALFVGRSNSAVRELVYNFQNDGYVSPDLTLLANHIVLSQVKQMEVQQGAHAVLYAAVMDGYVAMMTYDRPQDVVAWSRLEMSGEDTVHTVTTIYGSRDDEVWVGCTRKDGSGNTYRTIEYLDPSAWAEQDAGTFGGVFVDSATVYSGASTTTVAVPEHLEGRTLKVLADGAVVADAVVSSNQITLLRAATDVICGLEMAATLIPNMLETQLPDGSSAARKKRINAVAVKLYKSARPSIQNEGGEREELFPARSMDDAYDTPPPLFTGVEKRPFPGSHDLEATVKVVSSSPLPCCVLSLVAEVQTYG